MQQATREDVHLLLCLLGILDPLLQHQERVAPELAKDLAADLINLISKHRSVLVRKYAEKPSRDPVCPLPPECSMQCLR